MDMKKTLIAFVSLILLTIACTFPSNAPAIASDTPVPADTIAAEPVNPSTETSVPTLAPSTETFTVVPPTETATATTIPFVESLDATVTADLLSCRYGPGSEYLYLIAFRKTTPLKLIGRTDGNNWVLVKNEPQKCWVNAKFIEVKGDPQALKVAYPSEYKLPVSPYYSSPAVLKAVRDPNNKNKITVEWTDITLRAGDEEDENMFIYIIEIWRCEGGKTIFDPLASNYPEVTFIDEAGCGIPSHGRVFFQEKHGYAGPAEIVPWPEQ